MIEIKDLKINNTNYEMYIYDKEYSKAGTIGYIEYTLTTINTINYIQILAMAISPKYYIPDLLRSIISHINIKYKIPQNIIFLLNTGGEIYNEIKKAFLLLDFMLIDIVQRMKKDSAGKNLYTEIWINKINTQTYDNKNAIETLMNLNII